MITNQQNQVVWRWDNQDPFGANVPDEDPNNTGNHFTFNPRFPGQYFDRETNLAYNLEREYDPSIGRYIDSDPIGLQGGVNTYSYGNGSPILYADPGGNFAWIGATAIAGAFIGAASGAITAAGKPEASLGSIAIGAGLGLVTGAAAGAEAGIVATIAVGAVAAGGAEYAAQLISGKNINVEAIGTAAVLGGLGGGTSYGLLKLGLNKWLSGSLPAAMATMLQLEEANAASRSQQCK